MDARKTWPAIAASLLLCSGCWLVPSSTTGAAPAKAASAWAPARPAPAHPATAAPSKATPPAAAAVPPFANAPGPIRGVAREFVSTVCEYDAVHEARGEFLGELRGLATAAELHRLAASPRAELPWRVLGARAEQVRLQITGISIEARGQRVRVIVEAIATTRTTFATVRSFEQITLDLAKTATGWLVDDARGAGL